MKYIVTLVATALFSVSALANHHDHEPKDGPCLKVKQACEAAGFEKGKHKEKKGLMMDCMKPLMHGETVAGVTIAPEDLQACKDKKEHHKEHKEKKGKGEKKSEG